MLFRSDAGLLFRKLRKNLGNKNCEFAPEHIREIVSVYGKMEAVDRVINPETQEEQGIAAQIFDNTDFGYYKVTIERPKRLKAQFAPERIAELRFDKTLREPMRWAYETFGDNVYSNLRQHEKEITEWCEKNDLNLNSKQSRALVSDALWTKQLTLLNTATAMMHAIGTDEYNDFNVFREKVDACCKDKACLVSTAKNEIGRAHV